jgi:hypothetical protein
MNYHHEILPYLPAQATATGFIPVILLAFAGPARRIQLPLKLVF